MTDPAATATGRPATPVTGEVIVDARGGGRVMRVTWHHEVDLVVLSVWKDESCVATVRVPRADVPALVNTLVSGLADRPEPTTGLPNVDR